MCFCCLPGAPAGTLMLLYTSLKVFKKLFFVKQTFCSAHKSSEVKNGDMKVEHLHLWLKLERQLQLSKLGYVQAHCSSGKFPFLMRQIHAGSGEHSCS